MLHTAPQCRIDSPPFETAVFDKTRWPKWYGSKIEKINKTLVTCKKSTFENFHQQNQVIIDFCQAKKKKKWKYNIYNIYATFFSLFLFFFIKQMKPAAVLSIKPWQVKEPQLRSHIRDEQDAGSSVCMCVCMCVCVCVWVWVTSFCSRTVQRAQSDPVAEPSAHYFPFVCF